jgi:hypothetical protein
MRVVRENPENRLYRLRVLPDSSNGGVVAAGLIAYESPLYQVLRPGARPGADLDQ